MWDNNLVKVCSTNNKIDTCIKKCLFLKKIKNWNIIMIDYWLIDSLSFNQLTIVFLHLKL